jgi:hypothetical protein
VVRHVASLSAPGSAGGLRWKLAIKKIPPGGARG